MWWKPENEYESLLASDIEKLGYWFQEQRMEMSIASGYGSVYQPETGKLVPLVVLNTDFLHSWHSPSWSERGHRLLWSESGLRDSDSSSYFTGDFLNRLPRNLKLNLPLHFIVASRPYSASLEEFAEKIFVDYLRVRKPLVCEISKKSGTAGVSVIDKTGTLGVLTAGHVFDNGLFSPVGIRRFWKRTTHVGSVTHHIAPPKNGVDWDAAVVKFDESISKFPPHLITNGLVERFEEHKGVIIYGAQSGVVREAGVLAGALNTIGRWKNCWMLAPSGILKDGDSGAAVFTSDGIGKYLGTYVGCSVFKGTQKPYIHYVQDAYSLHENVLKNWDISYY